MPILFRIFRFSLYNNLNRIDQGSDLLFRILVQANAGKLRKGGSVLYSKYGVEHHQEANE